MPNIQMNEAQLEFEQEAMAMALGDPKAKLMSLFGKDKVQNLKIIQVSELPPESPMPRGAYDHDEYQSGKISASTRSI